MKRQIRICTALLILNLTLIWGNSLLPGTGSEEMSGSLLQLIMDFLRIPEGYEVQLHNLIRKLAHFTEFACLGALLCWRFRLAGIRDGMLAGIPVLCSMAAALVDETIQMFVPDRGPSLIDVWIDVGGAAAGMILLLCGYHFFRNNNNKT